MTKIELEAKIKILELEKGNLEFQLQIAEINLNLAEASPLCMRPHSEEPAPYISPFVWPPYDTTNGTFAFPYTFATVMSRI